MAPPQPLGGGPILGALGGPLLTVGVDDAVDGPADGEDQLRDLCPLVALVTLVAVPRKRLETGWILSLLGGGGMFLHNFSRQPEKVTALL